MTFSQKKSLKCFVSILSVCLLFSCKTSSQSNSPKDELEQVSKPSQADDLQESLSQELRKANESVLAKQWRSAERSYDRVLTIDSEHSEAIRNLGIVKFKLKEYHQALKLFERVQSFYANRDFDFNFYRAETNRVLARFAQAAASYEAALKIKPKDVMTLKSLSWTYFRLNAYKEALAVATKGISLHPGDIQLGLIKVRIFLKLGRMTEVNELLTNLKKTASQEQVPFIQSVEGDASLATDNCEKATVSYKSALKKEPLLAGALLGLGKCTLKMGEIEKGAELVESALRIQPKLVEAYYILAQVYEKSDPKRSMAFYKAFYQRSASDPFFAKKRKDVKEKVRLASSKSESAL